MAGRARVVVTDGVTHGVWRGITLILSAVQPGFVQFTFKSPQADVYTV